MNNTATESSQTALAVAVVAALLLMPGIAGAQSSFPFVAADFEVPATLETEDFRLRMLTVNDVIKDYDAVMSSADYLIDVWPDSGWPVGLTLEQNLVDLGWHQGEFERRRSFAYTVVTLDGGRVVGCVYINPTRKRGYDAQVYLWAREAPMSSQPDAELYEAVGAWLASEWPFENPAFPGRSVDWDTWNAIPDEKR